MNPKLYFAFAVAAFLTANANVAAAVLDTDGEILLPGISYHILPAKRGCSRGGGVTVMFNHTEFCSVKGNVIQANSVTEEAARVRFSNWAPKVAFVPESTDLIIEIDLGITVCQKTPFWGIGEFDGERNKWFVSTGAGSDGFGPGSVNSLFKIEKSENLGDAYKIVFCPSNCESCRPICGDVGIFEDENGVLRLALSDWPFEVVFKKAKKRNISTETM
ncbi:PREDICTED: 21 kDa seed protein-like [Tarenaya hassleriana]|uniref:21 kDa seed protein-like n=1 Tax=Tarenaya hassleriana TaxID=28532 RepID=UPI00053C31B8|nr:PREDICTED: 21 kDa seed protein-like [Tarenaya hassleriana]